MSNNDPDFQSALARARDEFSVLTFGKEKPDIVEALELRDYAKKRTDLLKTERDLTPDQKAWKLIYQGIDTELKKQMSEKDLLDLDTKRDHMDEVGLATRNFGKLLELGKRIEISLFNERVYGIVSNPYYKEKSDYFEKYDQVCELMLKADTSKEKRLEFANTAIKLVEFFKDFALNKLEKEHEETCMLLSEFEYLYKQTRFEKFDDTEDKEHSGSIAKVNELFQKWMELTKKLILARTMAMTALKRRLECDLVLPKRTIEKDGDTSGNLNEEESNQFKESLTSSATLFMASSEKEKEISEVRDGICGELYGPSEKYLPQQEEQTKSTTTVPNSVPCNPLEGKAWFRLVKVVYICTGVVLGLLVLLILAMSAYEVAFWTAAIGIAIMVLVKKAFYYITLGKTDWKK